MFVSWEEKSQSWDALRFFCCGVCGGDSSTTLQPACRVWASCDDGCQRPDKSSYPELNVPATIHLPTTPGDDKKLHFSLSLKIFTFTFFTFVFSISLRHFHLFIFTFSTFTFSLSFFFIFIFFHFPLSLFPLSLFDWFFGVGLHGLWCELSSCF